jgi:hypothetical protein
MAYVLSANFNNFSCGEIMELSFAIYFGISLLGVAICGISHPINGII